MKSTINYIRKHKILLIVLIPAFVAHMIVIMPSGSRYCFNTICGLFFWGPHGHDAIWHLSVIQAGLTAIPFRLPIFSGQSLGSYNYLFDIILALISRIGISPLTLYFKIIPVVWFILIVSLTLRLTQIRKKDHYYTGSLLFFLLFGGSFSFIIPLLKSGNITGSSTLLTMQSGLSLINPQFAISLILILITLIQFSQKKHNPVIYAFLSAAALGLKFYAGIIIVFLIFVHELLTELPSRAFRRFFLTCVFIGAGCGLIILSMYLPGGSNEVRGGLHFDPLATIHPLIEDPNLLYMKDTVNARYFLADAVKQTGRISPRLIGIELFTLGLFIVFNLGTRIIGIIPFLRRILSRSISAYSFSMFLTAVFSITLTALFIQRGIWWNTIQFTYYAIFLSAFAAAEPLAALLRKKKLLTYGIALLIITFTLPSAIDTIYGFTRFPAPAYLSDLEHDALTFLAAQPNGVVYAPLYTPSKELKQAPIPLIAYDDTAYVSAFSGKQTFYANKTQLELLQIPHTRRRNQLLSGDCRIFSNVTYLYQIKGVPDPLFSHCQANLALQTLFENDEVQISAVIPSSTLTQ